MRGVDIALLHAVQRGLSQYVQLLYKLCSTDGAYYALKQAVENHYIFIPKIMDCVVSKLQPHRAHDLLRQIIRTQYKCDISSLLSQCRQSSIDQALIWALEAQNPGQVKRIIGAAVSDDALREAARHTVNVAKGSDLIVKPFCFPWQQVKEKRGIYFCLEQDARITR